MTDPHRILVAGIGNELLCDDGVGVHAVREFAAKAPEDVVVAEIGTAVLNSLHLLENAHRILAVDAVKAEGKPGEIHLFSIGEASDSDRITSIHEMGLTSAYRMLPGVTPPEIYVLGVEPKELGYGMDLSEPVMAAMPRLQSIMIAIVEAWIREDAETAPFDLGRFLASYQPGSEDSGS